MKNKIKVVSILALLTIGLVSCGKSNEPISSSSSSSIISSSTIYCGNVSTSSSSSEVISSSTSISSSSEDLSSSTGENLLDYITGTPETRREAYMATEDMYMNTFWGVFEK